MASGATVKMGVDVSGFKKGMQEATNSVKTLDAQLKTNEKQLKATGDAEVYMSNKAGLLEKQLEEQQKVVKNANDALQAMKDKGISPASAEFQAMERTLAGAMGKMFDIKTELNQVQTNAGGAAKETKGMNTELKNIGKGVAFQNVTTGLKTITDSLEKGARAAMNLGKKIVSSVRDSTGWADDVLTRATQSGVDAETIQRMDNVARFIDTDVDTILAARGRLAKNSDKAEELFGLKTDGMSLEDQFWAVGEAIQGMTDDVEREQAAQAVFGRGWKELVPLFAAGREEYSQLMEEQNVLTNEQVKKLGEADDQFQKMELEIQRLKNQFWAENSQTIINLLQWVIDNKDGVVTAITAIGGAFAALKVGELALNIKKVIDGFNTIKGMGGGGSTPTVPSGSEAAVAGEAGKKGLFSSIGGWLLDGLGISGAGLGLGLTISGGIIYLGGTAIANLNNAANLGREVATDTSRYAGLSDDQKSYLQGAVRALQHESGGSDKVDDMLLGIAGRMGGNLMDIFDYTNTSGEKRNKLADMLGMDDVNAAMAAAMIQAAGVDTTGLAGFDSALGKWQQFQQEGRQDWTAAYTTLAGLGGFFDRSGMMVDGKFTIPGYEARRIMSGAGPNPWELSGYAMTSAANKPTTYTYSDYNSQGELVSGWTGIIEQTWDPLKTKSSELEATFSGMNETVPVTNEEIRKLGEESETAMGHVSKFGELAGGSEHSVQDLGAAASSAAAALMSIRVPSFLANPHANGLPFVPYDGYLAMLHKGERVVPAREAGGSFSSNLYVESMYMNNGTDAEGLAAAMAAAQRRTMSGYGS